MKDIIKMNTLHEKVSYKLRGIFFLSAVFSLMTIGCVGFAPASRGRIEFDDLKYPASMSAYLYGPNNEILTKDKELKVVKKFYYEKKFWGIVYSAVRLSSASDIVENINKEIEELNGDGMVNVKVTREEGEMNYAYLMNWFPLWPGFTKIYVEGDIVKLQPMSALPVVSYNSLFLTEEKENVQIMALADQAATVQLNEHCKVVGKIETLAFRITSSEREELRQFLEKRQAFGIRLCLARTEMLDQIRMNAAGKGANMVQIIYLDTDWREGVNKASFAQRLSRDYDNAAMTIRYWSCPAQNAR